MQQRKICNAKTLLNVRSRSWTQHVGTADQRILIDVAYVELPKVGRRSRLDSRFVWSNP